MNHPGKNAFIDHNEYIFQFLPHPMIANQSGIETVLLFGSHDKLGEVYILAVLLMLEPEISWILQLFALLLTDLKYLFHNLTFHYLLILFLMEE